MQNVDTLENTPNGQPQGAGQQGSGESGAAQVEAGLVRPEDTSAGGRRSDAAANEAAWFRRSQGKTLERLAGLENAVTQLVTALSQPYQPQTPSAGNGQSSVDVLSNPDAYRAQIKNEILSELKPQIESVRHSARIDVENRMANDLIKSESGNDPEKIEEIIKIGTANRYDLIAREDPVLAAEKAIEDWKAYNAQKSVRNGTPLFSQNGNGGGPSRAQVAPVNGSAALANSGEWTPERIAKSVADGTYKANRAAILASKGIRR